MSSNNVNAAAAPATAAAPPPATASILSLPNIMASSYMYTSSTELLHRINAEIEQNKDESSIGSNLSSLLDTKSRTSVDSTTTNGNSNRLNMVPPTPEMPEDKKVTPEEDNVEIVKEKPNVKKLNSNVGLYNLRHQICRKAVTEGFEFTLMVVGESGLGKSTLINSMFLAEIYNFKDYPEPTKRLKKTVAVETTRVMLNENGVNLLLTLVDTPGFGDAVDNSNCWVPIIKFIESKYADYLKAEARVPRKTLSDQRVHCCLYFIQPSGHGLKLLDIECMKRLCDKVNIIPVIAKADTLTADECALFKKRILNQIAQHQIKIYDFPDTFVDDEKHKLNKSLKERVPFAIMGSNAVVEVDGKKMRGRKYPWGVAEVENLEHCDLIALRNMIIRTHLQNLKDVTNDDLYENYRSRKLGRMCNLL